MPYIAGHSFVDGPGGRICEFCSMRWLDIVSQREYWKPGEAGIAHQGNLSENEVTQLNAELDRIYKAMQDIGSSH